MNTNPKISDGSKHWKGFAPKIQELVWDPKQVKGTPKVKGNTKNQELVWDPKKLKETPNVKSYTRVP